MSGDARLYEKKYPRNGKRRKRDRCGGDGGPLENLHAIMLARDIQEINSVCAKCS